MGVLPTTELNVFLRKFPSNVLSFVVLEIISRRIVIPASAFDSKVKFLERTRKSFGGGTFHFNEGALLESYHLFLKEEYNEAVARQYGIALQQSKNDYWCLSRDVRNQ